MITNELHGKKLLILGGNNPSKEIVTKARSMGVYTIVTDWNDTKMSPAKLLADDYWNESIKDYENLSRLIRENGIDGIITGFTDSYLLPYQHLCEINNMPCYGTREQFDIFTNKDKFKALCRRFSVPTIIEYSPDTDNMTFPVLVKPADGSGSRGIMICHSKSELDDAIVKANNSSNRNKVIVEQYLDSKEVTVFWLFVDGQYYLTAIGNRHVKHNQKGNIIPLPVGYTFPSILTPKYQSDVEPNVKKMLSSIGIKNGMMFMQCKVENGSFRVYDIGFRLTGSLEYKILERICGIDPLAMLIRFSLTGHMAENGFAERIDPIHMRPSFNVSCLCAPGTIKSFVGLEDVRSFPEVIDIVMSHYPGQTITRQMKGLLSQIAVRIFGTVDKKEDLYPIMERIHDSIRIVSDDDKDLLLPGIEKEDIDNAVI